MNDKEIMDSLKSTICPKCEQKKTALNSFCSNCYWKLPLTIRRKLHSHFYAGYRPIFNKALKLLTAGSSSQDTPTVKPTKGK